MTINIGDRVKLKDSRSCSVVSIYNLFGQDYANVFVEPDGPILQVAVSDLEPKADISEKLSSGQTIPAPLFLARLTAQRLNALLTQQGLLSAANFRVTPLPHQVLAVDFVLGQFRPRAMLAEEVGLGKTIEAAMIFEELKLRRQARRVLIITPAGLTRQWQDELSQKFGEQFVVVDRTLFTALREIHGQEANLWLKYDHVITSLDFIKPLKITNTLSPRERQRRETRNRNVFEHLLAANWDMVIVDEAHKLSKDTDGSETARYKIGEALSETSPVLLLLTATPHQGKPGKFLHLLNLIDPIGFTQDEDLTPEKVSQIVWRTRKRAAVDAEKKPLFKQRITDVYPVDLSRPDFALERKLYDEVSEYVSENYNKAMRRNDRAFGFLMILFQRMLTSSTQAISDSLEKRLKRLISLNDDLQKNAANGENGEFDEERIEDEDSQEVLSELIETPGVIDRVELADEIKIIKELIELARRVLKNPDAKMIGLLDILDEVRRRDGPATKVLLFTEFIATQQALRKLLEDLGYKVVCINGGMNLPERTIARQEFAGTAQIMISTDAGGEGINLQFCHVMVNYDLPWNPAKLEQRIGRLDRIGQDHNVFVLNMLTQDTVEQRVRQVLEQKLSIIRSQFGDDKLADILSTLQDEFRFDRLYMEAVAKREAEAINLEKIGDQIYQRARQILDQDDLLLPHAKAEVDNYKQRLVEVTPNQMKAMLSGYLVANGENLHEYSRRPGVFYFDFQRSDGSKEHYTDVVFDRNKAVEDDGLTFLHLNHPLIEYLLNTLNNSREASVAQLRIREPNMIQEKGVWAVYRLSVTDNKDLMRQEIISIFVSDTGVPNLRYSRILLDITPDQVDTAFQPISQNEIDAMRDLTWKLAEKQAGNRFTEIQLEQSERINNQRRKVEQYYRQQESAVHQIAIENIRLAKQKELLERRRADLESLDNQIKLVPDLRLSGLAWVYNE